MPSIAAATWPSATLFAAVATARWLRSRCASRGKAASKPAASSCIAPPTTAAMRKSERWPAGKIRINHVYATYQYPADRKYAYPVLFNPGGGHTARVYDTTPDGREGWLTQFPRAGFAVYGVDRVNTGRAGGDICAINAARLGKIPAAQMPAINRYSAESAWVTFRWGPKFGDVLSRHSIPEGSARRVLRAARSNTYRDPRRDAEIRRRAGRADRQDRQPVVLQSWSSSGLMIYLAAIERAERVKGILALEHSAGTFDGIDDNGSDSARDDADPQRDRRPHARTASPAHASSRQRMAAAGGSFTADVLPEAGIRGNGHTLMLEKNNAVISERMIAWMKREVYGEK